MVNAWSLAASILDGTFDKDYPIMTEITGNVDISTGVGNTTTYTVPNDIKHSTSWYDYTRNDPDAKNPFTDAFDYAMGEAVVNGTPYPQSYLSDNDDQIAHHIDRVETSLNYDELTLNIEDPTKEIMSDSRNKYHEEEILKDVEEYVSRTYNGHYTGTKHEYRNVQTIDLMASRDLASDFCQANILKYGSRYGSKDGKNKKDLLKVIHYAMLLLHFDEHYGKPSMTSGNIDHNMP